MSFYYYFFLCAALLRCSICNPIIPPASFHTFIEIVHNLCRILYKFFQELKWKALAGKLISLWESVQMKFQYGLTEENEQFGFIFDEIHVL